MCADHLLDSRSKGRFDRSFLEQFEAQRGDALRIVLLPLVLKGLVHHLERHRQRARAADETRVEEQEELAPALLARNDALVVLLRLLLTHLGRLGRRRGRIRGILPRARRCPIEGEPRRQALLEPLAPHLEEVVEREYGDPHVAIHVDPREIKRDRRARGREVMHRRRPVDHFATILSHIAVAMHRTHERALGSLRVPIDEVERAHRSGRTRWWSHERSYRPAIRAPAAAAAAAALLSQARDRLLALRV